MLKTLKITNFKNIKSLELDLTDITLIKGFHKVGKTSISDAILWVLFGKDINNTKSFNPYPINEKGDYYECGGVCVELYTTNGGYVKKTLTLKLDSNDNIVGNDYKYFCDKDIEVRKKDFDSYVQEKFGNGLDLDTLFIVYNPKYFHSLDFKTQDRRKLLLEISGVPDNKEMLKEFSTDIENGIDFLESIIDKDLYKESADYTQLINKAKKQIETLAFTIKENEKDFSEKDFSELETKKNIISAELQQLKDAKLNTSKIVKNEAEYNAAMNKRYELLDKLSKAKLERINTEKTLQNEVGSVINILKNDIENIEKLLIEKRNNAAKVNERKFNPMACSSCGQDLPQDQIEKLEHQFNEAKKSEFNAISDEGFRLRNLQDKKKEELSELIENDKQIFESNKLIKEQIAEQIKRIQFLETELNSIVVPEKEYLSATDNDARIEQLQNELEPIEAELSIKAISDHAKVKNKQLSTEKLNVQNQMLEYIECKKLIDSFNKFIIEQVNLRVSRLFDKVVFKMFDIPYDGVPRPVCVATIDGIEFPQLNGESQVIVHNEISNALKTYYKGDFFTIIDAKETALTVQTSGNSLMLQATDNYNPNAKILTMESINKEIEIVKIL